MPATVQIARLLRPSWRRDVHHFSKADPSGQGQTRLHSAPNIIRLDVWSVSVQEPARSFHIYASPTTRPSGIINPAASGRIALWVLVVGP
jgi:hypothetical protein